MLASGRQARSIDDMKTVPFWHGVRMRRTLAGADADAPLRLVSLPASWEDAAASSLVALAGGAGPVRLTTAAEAFIRPLAERAAAMALDIPLAARLRALLLRRRGAPDGGIWQGRSDEAGGFALNLAAFHDPGSGFAVGDFAEAVETAVWTLALARPAASRIAVRIADLAGLLAALGLDYESAAARDLGAAIAALVRGRADAASARLARIRGRAEESAPRPGQQLPPPPQTPLPGLTEAAAEALREASAAPALSHTATTALAAAGPAEGLLGVETAGVAPAFGPVRPEGGLTRAARAWLAARGVSAEAAVARALAGEALFPVVSAAATAAMQAGVATYLHEVSPLASAGLPAPAPSTKEVLPARARGYTQKVSMAGHRLFLRTGEYADGRLGEIAIALNKEGPAVRGIMDAFATAVSLGLQHGVPLDEFVEAFLCTRFGPAGAVDGDAAVPRATSMIDYVFRNLATNYLNRRDLPAAEPEDPAEFGAAQPEGAPLLPLDLPATAASAGARRRALRLVSK